MRDRDVVANASGGRIGRVLLAVGLAIALGACGSTPGVPSGSTAIAPSTPMTAVPSSEPSSDTPSPSVPPGTASAAAASAAPSGPVLDPEHCPPTLPPADDRTADGMDLEGDPAFVTHVKDALALLEGKAPDAYTAVVANVTRIRSVPSFSGMCYDTGTYRVGEETAYAPGYPPAQQAVWLAGTIVHDGCHRERYVQGLTPSGRDAELACLESQLGALESIDEQGRFRDYVQDLIETADDPNSQYWNATNRHW